MMIVITGATGHIGSKLTDFLLNRREKVRVVGRDEGRLKAFTARGAEAAVGDLNDASFVLKAFKGAEAVFTMIPPNYLAEDFRAYQRKIADNLTQAIEKRKVHYIVNLSSQGAHLPEGTGPIAGLHDMEERLNGLKGIHVLHLRPASFMENLLMNVGSIRSTGSMGSALKGDMKMPMIATKDIAAYAAERLVRKDFTGKTVADLLGERDVTMTEAARIIGTKIGKPGLAYVQYPYEETEKALMGMGLSKDVSRLFVEMSRAMNDGLISEGRKRTPETTTPTSIEEFADVFASVYHGAAKAA
jgi:uncharacterized protein YbjT (DUF2867 family)